MKFFEYIFNLLLNFEYRLSHMEQVGEDHDRLLVELGETVGEKTSRIELDLGRFRETQTEQLRSLSKSILIFLF